MAKAIRTSVAALLERPNAQVLIIGGGINGIATARDLALQGVDVALVERNDFAAGASSASSHMVHGGIRYLENGEIRLVHEAVVERNDLVRTAPHYVRPLPTTIPIFRTFAGILHAPLRLLTGKAGGKHTERGALLIKIGLIMYDAFSRAGRVVPKHIFRSKWASLAAFAQLNPKVAYTATYFDASMHNPERLALDVLGDAIDAGARAANQVEAVGTEGNAVVLRDLVSGSEFSFDADLVINASGPWTDLTNAAIGQPSEFMGGTKGSHIVLDNLALLEATHGNEIFFEHRDGRIVLIYPLRGRVIVGTTDTDADPSQPVVCTDEDIDYFFDLIRHVFPFVGLDRSQIVYTYAGIRPLPGHGDLDPGFVSRDYRIEPGSIGSTPTLSLVGGKWTTFRASAEHLTNDALAILGVKRTVTTQGLAIGGGRGYPREPATRATWIREHAQGHDEALVERMLERYGTKADTILAAMPVEEFDLAEVPGYRASELQWIAQNEQVNSLADVVLRRTSLAFHGGLTKAALTAVARAIAPVLHWSDSKAKNEVNAVVAELRDLHRVEIGA